MEADQREANTRMLIREHLGQLKSAAARSFESELKLPTSTDLYPSIFWVGCVVCPFNEPSNLHGALTPELWEAEQLASWIDFSLATHYTESFAARVRERQLPLCAGHNTTTFLKLPAEPRSGWSDSAIGWGYKQSSWDRHGAWPHSFERSKTGLAGPLSLVQALDRRASFAGKPNPKWDAWKAEHADLFPASTGRPFPTRGTESVTIRR